MHCVPMYAYVCVCVWYVCTCAFVQHTFVYVCMCPCVCVNSKYAIIIMYIPVFLQITLTSLDLRKLCKLQQM